MSCLMCCLSAAVLNLMGSVLPSSGQLWGSVQRPTTAGSIGSRTIDFLPNALLASGIGLYAHMTSRRHQQTGTKGAACTKRAEPEGGQATSKSVSSQPSVPIAQSKQPLGGLFEPVGCPELGTPCRHEPQSFIQSFASSTRSRSKLSCSLRSYPGAAAVPAVSAVHVQAGSIDSRQQPQHAQQALPGTLPNPAPLFDSTSSAKHGSAAGPASSAHLPQHAQHGFSSQHGQQAADDALSQEAAAAEAVLDSFSRMSSAEALQSHLRSGPAAHYTQPAATASTAATQEAVSQQSAGPEPAQVAAQQQPTGLAKTAAQQQQPPVMAQLGKDKLGGGSSMRPQQGYPGQQAGVLGGRDSKPLSEAQVRLPLHADQPFC